MQSPKGIVIPGKRDNFCILKKWFEIVTKVLGVSHNWVYLENYSHVYLLVYIDDMLNRIKTYKWDQ